MARTILTAAAVASVAKMTLRSRAMELLVDMPSLSVAELSSLLGAPASYIRQLIASDEFRTTLSELTQRKYKASISQVRQKMMDTAERALDGIVSVLEGEANPAVKVEAARLALEQVKEVVNPVAHKSEAQAGGPQINVSISLEDLNRAREKHAARAATLTIEANDVEPQPLGLPVPVYRNDAID